jgi:ABC-type amino acid transport substrate-binding protein
MYRSRSLDLRVQPSVVALAVLGALVLWLAGSAPARAGATVDRIKATGKLNLGYRSDLQPFSFRDDSGNPAGYSVVLCQKVADEAKASLGADLDVEFVPVTYEETLAAIQGGKIDLLCAATQPTLARRADVSFSIAILASGTAAVVRKDAPARLRDVLAGKAQKTPNWRASSYQILEKRVFSVITGSPAERVLNERLKELALVNEVVPVPDYSTGFRRVADGESDVFFGDRAILLDAARRNAAADQLIVLPRFYTRETLALAMAKGDDDFRLLVDRALSRFFRSKDIGALYATYFGPADENVTTFFQLSELPE